jgi:hypothetical protein
MTSDLQKLSKALTEDLPEDVLQRRLEKILKERANEITAALRNGEVYVDEKSGLKISAA